MMGKEDFFQIVMTHAVTNEGFISLRFAKFDQNDDGFFCWEDLMKVIQRYSDKFYSDQFLRKIILQGQPEQIDKGLSLDEFSRHMQCESFSFDDSDPNCLDASDEAQLYNLFGDLENFIAMNDENGLRGLTVNVMMVNPELIGAPSTPTSAGSFRSPSPMPASNPTITSSHSWPTVAVLPRQISLKKSESAVTPTEKDAVRRVI